MSVQPQPFETDRGLHASITAANRQSARAAASASARDLAASILWRRWLAAHMRLAAHDELGD